MPSILAPRALRSSSPAISLILAAACWGTGTVLSKAAVGVAAPLLLLSGQLASSLVFLGVITIARREPVRLVTQPRRVGALGLLNPGLAYGLALVGLTQVTASVAVVVWATEPAMVALLAAIVLGERLSRAVAALSVLAVVGIVFLAGEARSGSTAAGVAFLVTAVFCCAVYTVATRRWLPTVPETLGLVTAQQAAGFVLAVVVTVVAAATLGPGVAAVQAPPSTSGFLVIGSVVGSGVVYYGLAYWFYITALRRVEASLAAASFYLVPVFGLLAAFAFGERLEWRAWIGAGIVLVAITGIGLLSAPRVRGRAVDG